MIRTEGLRGDIRFLASDLLEGRGPATRGDQLARAYIAARFEGIGLEPGAPGGGWIQLLDIVGVRTHDPDTIRFRHGGDALRLRFREDFIAGS